MAKVKKDKEDAKKLVAPTINRNIAGVDDVLKSINKKHGVEYISGLRDKVVSQFIRYPTWFLDLDYALSGGIMMGKLSQLWGRPLCGKSTLMYRIMASVQNMCHTCFTPICDFIHFETGEIKTTCLCGKNNGGQILLIASEDRFDSSWATLNGVNIENRFYRADCPTTEVAADVLEGIIEKKACDAVFVDSFAALLPEEMIGGSHMPGRVAHAMQMMMGRALAANMKGGMAVDKDVAAAFKKYKKGVAPPPLRTTMVGTNQVRASMSSYGGDKTSGGNFLGHAITQSIRMMSPEINGSGIDKDKISNNVVADFKFKADKATNGGAGGGKGTYRIWTDDHKQHEVGNTGEAERIFKIFKDNVGFIDKEGKTFAGHTWGTQRELKQALETKGMQLYARWVFYTGYLNASAKTTMNMVDYDYNPFYKIEQDGEYEFEGKAIPRWKLTERSPGRKAKAKPPRTPASPIKAKGAGKKPAKASKGGGEKTDSESPAPAPTEG